MPRVRRRARHTLRLIPFHTTALFHCAALGERSENILRSDTLRANLTSDGGVPQRTSTILFTLGYGAHKNSLHLPKPVPVITPRSQWDARWAEIAVITKKCRWQSNADIRLKISPPPRGYK